MFSSVGVDNPSAAAARCLNFCSIIDTFYPSGTHSCMCDFLVAFCNPVSISFTSCVSWLFSIEVRAVGFLNLRLFTLVLPALLYEHWPHPGLNSLFHRFASIVSCSWVLHMHVSLDTLALYIPDACYSLMCSSFGCSVITTIYIWVQKQSAGALRGESLPQIASNSPWRRTRNVHCLVWPRFRRYREAI